MAVNHLNYMSDTVIYMYHKDWTQASLSQNAKAKNRNQKQELSVHISAASTLQNVCKNSSESPSHLVRRKPEILPKSTTKRLPIAKWFFDHFFQSPRKDSLEQRIRFLNLTLPAPSITSATRSYSTSYTSIASMAKYFERWSIDIRAPTAKRLLMVLCRTHFRFVKASDTGAYIFRCIYSLLTCYKEIERLENINWDPVSDTQTVLPDHG